MPEGPEAHTIAFKLNEKIVGKYIISYRILDKHDIISFDGLHVPNKIISVTAHGKRPIIILEKGYIVAFLAMKGRWSFEPDNSTTLEIILCDDVKNFNSMFLIEDDICKIYYSGKGPAGHVKYIMDRNLLINYFNDFGPDMLTSSITVDEYIQRVRSVVPHHTMVADFLREQKYFSGVGNYLRADIMYLSKLRPDRTMNSLTDDNIKDLYRYTKECMIISYRHGGLTMKDYWDPYGAKGVYPRIVYMKSHDPYGNEVKISIISNKQKIYWVPGVQV